MLLYKNVFWKGNINLSVVRVVRIVCVKSNENVFLHVLTVVILKIPHCVDFHWTLLVCGVG